MNPHPSLTEAWEQFQKENPGLFDAKLVPKSSPTGSVPKFKLQQRLQAAFKAGHAAGELAERKRIVEKIVEVEA